MAPVCVAAAAAGLQPGAAVPGICGWPEPLPLPACVLPAPRGPLDLGGAHFHHGHTHTRSQGRVWYIPAGEGLCNTNTAQHLFVYTPLSVELLHIVDYISLQKK